MTIQNLTGAEQRTLDLAARRGEQMLDALETVAGPDVRALVRLQPDPAIERIVSTWPGRFDSQRAARLGLVPDADVLGIVRQYLRDHPQAVKVPLRAGFGS